jgi:thymidylate kinase
MEIIVYEGFEMVGKTTSIDRRSQGTDAIVLKDFKDKFGYGDNRYGIDHTKSWIIGASWFHLINEVLSLDDDKSIIIDRGLLSSIVYTMMSDVAVSSKTHIQYLLDQMVSDYRKSKAKIVYLYHDDKSIAEKFYNQASKGRAGSDQFDKYMSFDHYWETYLQYHSKFTVIADLLRTYGIPVEDTGTSNIWRD